MGSGEVDTTALIIAICVIVPALIAIAVCAIIYFAHRKKDRKMNRQTNTSSYEYAHPRERERPNPNIYTIDFSRANRYQAPPPRRSREPPPVIEQPPPSYNNSISRSRLQPIPLYSSVRTTPSSNQIRRSSPVITPSVYSAMPPSYAEIFLTSSPLPNG